MKKKWRSFARKLLRNPRVSLLFTGFGSQYMSYQFNCDVELLQPQEPRFMWLGGMRLLFEKERFHIQQPEYPLSYVFHIRRRVSRHSSASADETGRKLVCLVL